MIVWSNGVLGSPSQLSSLNFSLQYASGVCWEGLRSYKQADGTCKIFKLHQHITRLFDSAKILGIQIPFTQNVIEQACVTLIEANGNEDLYLRPVVFLKNDGKSMKLDNPEVSVEIYAYPAPVQSKELKMSISNIIRGYPQYNMQCKCSPNYSMLEMAKQEILSKNVDDVFLVDNLGYITEARVANVWVFKGDVAMTPPNNGSILPGVTRKCLAELLQSDTMFSRYQVAPIVVEKQITKADLYTADCVILCGTYMEIANVVQIDGRQIGNKDSHKYYRILKTEFAKLTRGIFKDDQRSNS